MIRCIQDLCLNHAAWLFKLAINQLHSRTASTASWNFARYQRHPGTLPGTRPDQIQPEPIEAISPAIARPAMLTWTDMPRWVRICEAAMFSSFTRVTSCPINFKHSQGDKLPPSAKLKISDEVVNVGTVPSVRFDVLPMVWDLSITNDGVLIMLGCKAAMMFSMLRSLSD